MKEKYFKIYSFLHEENKYLREFKERSYIMTWETHVDVCMYVCMYLYMYMNSKKRQRKYKTTVYLVLRVLCYQSSDK